MQRSLTSLIYGSSKVGKSTLSVTSPAPRLYQDVEAASRFLPINAVYWNPAEGPPPRWDGTWDTCVVPTRDWKTVEQTYAWLQKGEHDFKSYILDSVSELQQRFIDELSGRSQLKQQDWGEVFRKVAGLIRDIQQLTMHPKKPLECVVFICMAKESDGKYRPHAQGQLGTTISYYPDLVGYLYSEMVQDDLTGEYVETRKLLTRGTAEFDAGERVGGKLPPIIENPNFSEMIEAIFPTTSESDSSYASEFYAETTTTNTEATKDEQS